MFARLIQRGSKTGSTALANLPKAIHGPCSYTTFQRHFGTNPSPAGAKDDQFHLLLEKSREQLKRPSRQTNKTNSWDTQVAQYRRIYDATPENRRAEIKFGHYDEKTLENKLTLLKLLNSPRNQLNQSMIQSTLNTLGFETRKATFLRVLYWVAGKPDSLSPKDKEKTSFLLDQYHSVATAGTITNLQNACASIKNSHYFEYIKAVVPTAESIMDFMAFGIVKEQTHHDLVSAVISLDNFPYLAVEEGWQLAPPPAPEPSTEEHTPSMTP